MIKFYVRKVEDDTILCTKILTTYDLVPPVLVNVLRSINCYPEIIIDREDEDDDFWKRMCFEMAADNEELLSD